MRLSQNTITARPGYDAEPVPIAQVFIFKDEACLGWDCFYKQTIRIGRDPGMDICLNEATVADKHAEVYIKGDKIVVSATTHELKLRVNDQLVTSAILNTLDYISIGPYTLKIKLPQIKNKRPSTKKFPKHPGAAIRPKVVEKWRRHADQNKPVVTPLNANRYRLIFDGDLRNGVKPQTVAAKLRKLLAVDSETVRKAIQKRQPLVLKNLSKRKAKKYMVALKKIGARCKLEASAAKPETEIVSAENRKATPTLKAIGGPEPAALKNTEITTAKDAPKTVPSPSSQQNHQIDPEQDEDDDLEEVENIQPFLKTALLENSPAQGPGPHIDHVLEIVKSKGDAVVDYKCLTPKEKYDIQTGSKRFRLAAYKSIESCHVYFSPSHDGHIKNQGFTDRILSDLCTTENIHRRKKKIYTIRLVAGQTFSIEDSGYRYQIRLIPRSESPKVSVPAKSTGSLLKNIVKSSGIHVVLVLLLSIFLSSPQLPDPKNTGARFVKIDMSQLQKPQPAAPKPKPVQPKKVTRPKTKAPEKPPKTKRVVQKKPKKAAPRKQVASSPNAGGGSDVKGNVKTRNIKQTGLLGLIGDGIGLAPKEALASVTNLDAVSSPKAADSNFKIGGIPGKLPGSKLELVSGDVVRSKGTQQVLRSAGIKGDGEVAALRNGQTGQNKAMAMVSVELNKSVRVQGGMSREAVKRIIDQHLDEISYCYENALIDAPSLMGNIVFEWKILMSGKVGAVRIKSSTIRSGQIHHCIQAAIKTWQFDKPQHSEVMVSYPFVFDIVGF